MTHTHLRFRVRLTKRTAERLIEKHGIVSISQSSTISRGSYKFDQLTVVSSVNSEISTIHREYL